MCKMTMSVKDLHQISLKGKERQEKLALDVFSMFKCFIRDLVAISNLTPLKPIYTEIQIVYRYRLLHITLSEYG